MDHAAAVLPRAWTDVDHVVGDLDGLLVVLDDEHRVAQVAEAEQGVDEAPVVPLVQADRRLVEHVEHADEAGADLAGQPDALRLAAGQGGGRAAEREVVEADVEQEPEAGVDLLLHPLGDQAVALGQLERLDGGGRVARSTCAHRSAMVWSAMVTPIENGFSRAPPHSGQGTSRM